MGSSHTPEAGKEAFALHEANSKLHVVCVVCSNVMSVGFHKGAARAQKASGLVSWKHSATVHAAARKEHELVEKSCAAGC